MSGRRKDVSAIHAVACPTCTAERGQDCVRMGGIFEGFPTSRFHAGRTNTAIEHYVRKLNEARRSTKTDARGTAASSETRR